MKRLVSLLFFLALIAAGLALVVPGFMDWTPYRGKIAQGLTRLAGRPVVIAGEVRLRMLPMPHVTAENVTVANAPDSKLTTPYLLKADSLDARIAFAPLLEGRVEIESLSLGGMDLQVEQRDGALPALPPGVHIDHVTVLGGVARYLNAAQGVDVTLPSLDLSFDALPGGQGYRAEGTFALKSQTISFKTEIGATETEGTPFKLDLGQGGRVLKLSGATRFSPAFSIQGGAELSGLSLTKAPADAPPSFHGKEAVTAAFSYKEGSLRLDDIKAVLGPSGVATGSAGMTFGPGQRPRLGVMLEASAVEIPALETWNPHVLTPFDARLTIKGKNLLWQGEKVTGLSVAAASLDGVWTLADTSVQFEDGGVARVAGTIRPESSVLDIDVQTPDLPLFIKRLPLSGQNALRLLSGAPLWRKAEVAARLTLKPDNIELADIVALFDDAVKMTGSVDVARGTPRPAFHARLTLDGVDSETIVSDTDTLFKSLAGVDASVDLGFSNARARGTALREVKLSAATEGADVVIKDLTATLSEDEGFDVAGRLTGLSPVTAFKVDYGLKAADGAALARSLRVPAPPFMRDWRGVNIRGRAEGAPEKYTFLVTGRSGGGEVVLDGVRDGAIYDMKVDIARKTVSRAAQGFTDLPGERLFQGGQAGFRLSARFAGQDGAYDLTDLRTGFIGGTATGSLKVQEDKTVADLTVDALDLSNWSDWSLLQPLEAEVKTKNLAWRGLKVQDAALRIETAPGAVSIPRLSGRSLGGTVDLALRGARKDGGWRTTMKGELSGCDIDSLRDRAGVAGFTMGRGDAAFELASSTPGIFDDWTAAEGLITLKPSTLSISGVNAAAAAKAVAAPGGQGLQRALSTALKDSHPAPPYTGVQVPVRLTAGTASVENVTLSGEGHAMTVKASRNLLTGIYEAEAEISFPSLNGAPPVRLRREGKGQSAGSYGVDVSALETWMGEKAMPMLDIPPVPEPVGEGAAIEVQPLAPL